MVEPELTTLYAIRYCLTRLSYAFGDGLTLIEDNLDMLVQLGWARTVISDLSDAVRSGRAVNVARAEQVLDRLVAALVEATTSASS